MKKMKDKVKKEKVKWFLILQNMDSGKFLPAFNVYMRRIQIRHAKFSFNRISFNFFKSLFGSNITTLVRCAIRSGMTYDDLMTYYINGRWLVNYLSAYYIPRCHRKVKVDSDELY
jgi:hypothetical protein